ncbi:MAG: hypothetical protein R3C19_07005 [Planctomycetaceae bacterium]
MTFCWRMEVIETLSLVVTGIVADTAAADKTNHEQPLTPESHRLLLLAIPDTFPTGASDASAGRSTGRNLQMQRAAFMVELTVVMAIIGVLIRHHDSRSHVRADASRRVEC